MAQQHIFEDPTRFEPQLAALEDHKDIFKGLYVEYNKDDGTVGGLRRRRRRAGNTPENPIKTVSLVEEDGVLFWRDGVPASGSSMMRRKRASAGLPPDPDGTLVLAKQFPVLAPNRVTEGIGTIDQHLNPWIPPTLRSRLRPLRRQPDDKFVLDTTDVAGRFAGRTLLFIHGTFSNADNMLGEFTATPHGKAFLNAAYSGERKYDNIVFLEHATLAVSPVINALELGRFMAGSSGQIDVIAHSRGGLIARWWLEAFGKSLDLSSDNPVRVVFAGSPLHGTSLAAPDKLQHALSLFSNIGTFAAGTMKLAGTANPFLWVASSLIEVVVSVTGALANTALLDALVALIPGLFGQSRISNNHELNLLRLGPCAVSPMYYVVKSNFETDNPGWMFWENFREDRMKDLAADIVFPGENDLVVDTFSMTELGELNFPLKVQGVCDFKTSKTVWHCNYFRQQETVTFITTTFI
jgi:pimeloyl-ACP methyl ester carboxylesterase